MNKAMRRIFSLCSCLLVTLSVGISFIQHTEKAQVVEATEYKIDNDGKKRAADKVYGDSKLPVSFKDVEYYDVYLPYLLTPKDIGGYSIGGNGGAMTSYVLEHPAYTQVMREYSNNVPYYNQQTGQKADASSFSYEKDTGMSIYTDKKTGTKYYITVIQPIFYKYEKHFWDVQGEWYSGLGGVIDVILTDGTVLHFTSADINAAIHTNGGGGANPDGIYYNKAKMKLDQYACSFQAMGGNSLEIWGSDNNACMKFREKYGLTEDGGVHIAYYRMYNKKVTESPVPVNDKVKKVSYKLGASTVRGNSAGGDDVEKTGNLVISGGFKPETEYANPVVLSEDAITLPTFNDLEASDRVTVKEWTDDIAFRQWANQHSMIRQVIALLGILIVIYSALLYIAYQFDCINNIVEWEMLRTITFGHLVISPDQNESTYKSTTIRGQKTVVHKDIIFICILGITFGVLILSGKLFVLLGCGIKLAKHFISLF